MKYDKLTICGIPKSFNLWDSLEYLDPAAHELGPEYIQYDAYPAECDEDRGEDAVMMFRYNESASGVYVVHNSISQTLMLELSPWAVEADVLMYVAYVTTILKKHKRTRLFSEYAPLPSLTEVDAQNMIADRRKYLKRLLTTKKGFTMEGLNSDFTLLVEHLRPAASIDMQIMELQHTFVGMQWSDEEED